MSDTGNNTQLAKIEVEEGNRFSIRELMLPETQDSIERYAENVVACAAFVPAGMNMQQAAVVIRAGLEVGLPPIAALKTIYLVHNRAGMESKAMLALLRRRPDLGYYLWGECSPQSATIRMFVRTPEAQYVEQTYTFTMEDAQRAGLAKDMYAKWPEVMLRNRAAANAMRASFPDLLLGCAYTPEELGAPVYVEGDAVVVDEEALARGEIRELDDGGRGAVEVAVGLGGAPGEIDFEDGGGAGSAQQLQEAEPSPDEQTRVEIREFVGTILEDLLPPEPWPEWADEVPSTKQEFALKLAQVSNMLQGDAAKALFVQASDNADGVGDVWVLVRSWWQGGELPAQMFGALCRAADVDAAPNPFAPQDGPAADEEGS